MKLWILIVLFTFSIILPVFTEDPEGTVCETEGGECIDGKDEELCEIPLGKLDCPNEEQCCAKEKDNEAAGLMSKGSPSNGCHNYHACRRIGGECAETYKCGMPLNDYCWPPGKCICCNTTCLGKEYPECTDANGCCKFKCEPYEYEVVNGCHHDQPKCKCCAPLIKKAQCWRVSGSCISKPKCRRDHIINFDWCYGPFYCCYYNVTDTSL